MEQINGNKVKNQEQDRRLIWLEDHYSTFNTEMGTVKEDVAKIKTDVSWLKKFFWIVATASIGGLIANIFSLMR